MILDNFIDSFDALKAHAKSAEYKDLKIGFDGVEYPNINIDIPPAVRAEVENKLSGVIGEAATDVTMFIRQSPQGVRVPHIVHSDNSLGTYSLMLYINDHSPDGSGTAFMAHNESGIGYACTSPAFINIIRGDQNNLEAWRIVDMANMKPNRAVIFDATRLHAAMPVGGFGSGKLSRTVLTAFFK